MKIGIFGGTFNPIHFGHIKNAHYIKKKYSLDRIIFIPSKYPVHKNLEGNIPAEDRYKMICLAIENSDEFKVSRIEIDSPGKSYTVLTLKELLKIHKNSHLYLIIGGDAFNEIDTWKDYKKLIDMVPFIVMRRQGSLKYKSSIKGLLDDATFADNPVIEISSSGIRENIKKNLPIKDLVPENVIEYILEKELYKN